MSPRGYRRILLKEPASIIEDPAALKENHTKKKHIGVFAILLVLSNVATFMISVNLPHLRKDYFPTIQDTRTLFGMTHYLSIFAIEADIR